MSKDKKQNIILGVMIFVFVVFMGVTIAWGLGYITTNSKTTSNLQLKKQNVSNVQKNIIM